MKFFSEILNKLFDTSDSLEKAEAEYKAEQEKKTASKKQKQALKKEISDTFEHLVELMSDYYETYGELDPVSSSGLSKIFNIRF